jgi:hypothetical protein
VIFQEFNGSGFAEDLNMIEKDSLGAGLIKLIARQLNTDLVFKNNCCAQTTFIFDCG